MDQYRSVLLLMLIGLSAPATAEKLYRWLDESGNVTYSQVRPPAGIAATEVELKGIPDVSNEAAREQLDSLRDRTETARKDREFKANYATESRAREQRLKENCETARQNLRVLETASRIQGEDGQFIDDAQRAARLEQARQQIQNFCQ